MPATKTTTVVNKRFVRPREGDVSVMRPSIFGNPFRIGPDGTREEVLTKYQRYFVDRLASDPVFNLAARACEGKRLVCCCRPPEGFLGRLLCHAQLIAAWCDELDDPALVP